MNEMVEVVLASGNSGKLKELTVLLQDLPFSLKSQSDFAVPEAVEDGLSFIENAIIKARHAAVITNRPALADDSGIAVDALGGAPGIYSARYAGEHASDRNNLEKLLDDAAHLEPSQRGCQFICVAAFVRNARDPMPIIAQGVWRGQLLRRPRGEAGFGYDPIFLPDGFDQSSAELTPRLKNTVSHRALALGAMAASLAAEFARPEN